MREPRYLGRMLRQVTAALAAGKVDPRDAATAALARQYARLMDAAAPAAKYAAALDWLAGDRGDQDADKHIRTITTALAAHSVASDLGPKLLAALEALQLSPRARAVVQKGGIGDKPSANPLDQLAARRAGRGHAPAVDAPAQES